MEKVLSQKMAKLENIEMGFSSYLVKTLKALRIAKRDIDNHIWHTQITL